MRELARRGLRPGMALAAAGLLTVLTAAGPPRASAARPAATPVSLSSLYWIYYKEDLSRLQPMAPGLIGQTLSGPGSYALEHNAGGSPLPSGVRPVQLFFSYADEQAALQGGGILPGVKMLAYDPEDWAATPVAEQQQPLSYMRQFAAAAKAGGYQVEQAPGRDLMQVSGAACGQQKGQTLSQAYVSCNLAGAAAGASIYVIQAAPVETDLPDMTQLVKQAAAQARAANPNAIVLATLSTTTPGNTSVSGAAINAAARAALPYVQGFEVNSTAATDSQFIAFLHDLSGN